MKLNLVGPFVVNAPFGTEIAFSKGLKQLGVEVREIDPNVMTECPEDGDATIVFKSCVGLEDVMLRGGPPVIVYQPDDARFPHIREMMMMMRKYSDVFLAFDRHSVEAARKMGYRIADELLLTADPDLYTTARLVPRTERDIDVSFIGSLGDPVAHASRRKMLTIAYEYAQKKNLRMFFDQTQDIPRIVDVYQRSKVVLNHATDVGQAFGSGFGLQCRHFEVGMTKTCLLSNQRLGLNGPDKFQHVTYFDEHSLISQIEYLLTEDNYTFHANQLYEDIRVNHMPIHRAAQIVNFIHKHL